MDIGQIIAGIEESECSKCNIGKCLKVLRDLKKGTDEPMASIEQPPVALAASIPHGSKICKTCGKRLFLIAFPANKGCKDGHEGTCRQCRSEKQQEYYKKKINASQKDSTIIKSGHSLTTHPHGCDKCEKRFRTLYGLQEHKRLRHGAEV